MTDAPASADRVIRDLGRGLARIAKKHPDYLLAKETYEGTRKEVHTNPDLQKVLEESAEGHPLAFAHIPVDVRIDRVVLTGITAKGSSAEKALDEVIGSIDYLDAAEDWHRKAGYFGDYYVVLDPIEEEGEEGGPITITEIAAVGASPLSSVIIYDARDDRTPLFGVRRWYVAGGDEGKGTWHAAVYYDDATVQLVTGEGQSEDTTPKSDAFMVDGEDLEDATITHPGERMLMLHFRVGSAPYGTPLHKKAYGPQDAITKISATNLANVDTIGFPARYALMDPEAELDDDDAEGGFDFDFTAGAKRPTEPAKRITTKPGSMTMLRGVKSVGELAAADSDPLLKNAEWYVQAMAITTGTPLHAFNLGGVEPSGEARRRAEAPLVKSAEKIAKGFTWTHKEAALTLLALRGLDVDEDEVTVAFGPVETASDAEGMELVASKIANGIPPRTALLEAGYTGDELDSWGWTEEAKGALTIDAAGKIAEALTKLGQAKVTGAITDAQLAALLPSVFGEATEGAPVELGALEVEPLDLDAEPAVEARDPRIVAAEVATAEAAAMKARADAIGALVRAGADASEAATALGITGVSFPNVPTTVRIPEEEATGLEGTSPAAPAAPPVPAAPEAPIEEPETPLPNEE